MVDRPLSKVDWLPETSDRTSRRLLRYLPGAVETGTQVMVLGREKVM
jgi:hypothetical protein